MFYLNKSKNAVLDTSGRVVGKIKEGKFSQSEADPAYRSGLMPVELEQISEVMQRQSVVRSNS